MTVKSILQEKGSHIHTVRPFATVSEAVRTFMIEDIGALVVSHDDKTVEGILSERDVVIGIAEYGESVLAKPVSFLMTHDVQTCTPDDRITDIKRIMSARRIRHLPVIENGALCGMVSILDVVGERLEEVEADASAMQSYISGGPARSNPKASNRPH